MPKNKKILLIEDDEMISSMYKTKLEADGMEVVVAVNGSQGLEMAEKEKPGLIILDVMLPMLDGFSVLAKIKEIKGLAKVPVIMLTNLGTEEDKKKGEDLGAIDYLVKSSLTPAQVNEKVKKYIK